MKFFHRFILVIVCLAPCFLYLNAQTGVCCPYTGWNYVVPITINNTAAQAANNRLVLVLFNTSTPIAQGKMKADGSDIRFTNGTCGNYLSHYIENDINTTNTHIWVRVPAVPANGSTTIYMYYGNASASSIAVSFNTFFPSVLTINNAQTLSGVQAYDWIDVRPGGSITMNSGQPVTLQATKIIFSGSFNGDFKGYAPQAGPGAGVNGGGGSGGSGGSYGGAGGTGGSGVSAVYGTPAGTDIDMGSGGGGSDCPPTGAGGGMLKIVATNAVMGGSITVAGQTAQNCCCGNNSEAAAGGAGGGVLMQGQVVEGTCTINANGGKGGDSDDKEGGGGGGGGRVKVLYSDINTFSGQVTVAGGANGSGGQSGMQPGKPGTYNQAPVSGIDVAVNTELPVSIPTAAFTFTNACIGSATSFTNTSTVVSGGSITQYAWNFGGATSAQASPNYTFPNAGNFNVQLTVTTSTGCISTVTQPVTVQAMPTANFTASSACQGNPTAFTDASSPDAVNWNWNFGDGGTGNVQNPLYTYAGAGSFNVTLVVSNAGNCSATVTKTVTVNSSPVAGFTAADVCYPGSVTFTNTTTGTASSVTIDFGDGQTLPFTQQNLTHTYAAPGAYNVVMVAGSLSGCSDTAVQQITVYAKPLAAFTAPAVCNGTPTLFTDNSSIGSGNIANHQWHFGDGATQAQQNASHTYTAPQTYNVTLIVVSDNNCSDTVTQTVTVNPNPVAGFTSAPVCLNSNSTFTDVTTVAGGNVAQWYWSFGDGQTSNTQNPVHVYTTPGNYTVSLLATSNQGCVDSTSKQVDVFDTPVAAFSATEVCQGLNTDFTDGSSINSGSIAQWNYDFGDGQTSAQGNTTHLYAVHGNYNTMLVVTSNAGCKDTAGQTVVVNPLPVVNFTAPPVCLSAATVFANTTTIATGNITSQTWNFGDGNSSADVSAVNTYAATGSYPVTLTAVSDKGCPNANTQTAIVYDLPVLETTVTPACYDANNGTATVIATAGTPPYNYNWDNGQAGQTALNLPGGEYVVAVTDANGCNVVTRATVTQPTGPLTISVTPDEPTIKLTESVAITLGNSYNDNAASYTVTPATSLSCSQCAQFNAAPYNTTTYNVQVTDANNCKGETTFTITVDQGLPLFIPNVFTPNGDGKNDTWGIFSNAVKYLNLAVFNRWGEKVFETTDLDGQWDGTYRGVKVPDGVYIYQGTIGFINNTSRNVKGGITITK